ncbi:uncharacterized protein LMH87_008151 [Akanthomyces muscarius]|uniref:Uncharacterized protein n=1 Tax=Akanthomyces muscarius TaxID=2231603 RepID=A0A9W8QL31_AKAMU|nr:uncharacterized protein LMH87_008151 [Akanthomyces muscarius]KAJ4159243.1 hypothetical protein LMH87_008151 [Akanthomyces muscarius]
MQTEIYTICTGKRQVQLVWSVRFAGSGRPSKTTWQRHGKQKELDKESGHQKQEGSCRSDQEEQRAASCDARALRLTPSSPPSPGLTHCSKEEDV